MNKDNEQELPNVRLENDIAVVIEAIDSDVFPTVLQCFFEGPEIVELLKGIKLPDIFFDHIQSHFSPDEIYEEDTLTEWWTSNNDVWDYIDVGDILTNVRDNNSPTDVWTVSELVEFTTQNYPDEIQEYVRQAHYPAEVFEEAELQEWATDNDYVHECDLETWAEDNGYVKKEED